MIFRKLPNTITVDGKEIKIKTDFRNWITFISIFEDKDIPNNFVRIELLCKSVLNETVKGVDIDKMLDAFFSFYNLNKKPKKIPKSLQTNEITYNFEEDKHRIFTSFYEQYGIDLYETDMHWFKFKSLFDDLGADTPLMKIVEYRTTDLEKIKDKKHKSLMADLKTYHSLQTLNIKTSKEIEREMLEKVKGG